MEVLIGIPVIKSFLVGSFSGTCSTLLFQPLDLVKTRLQTGPKLQPGLTAPGVIGILGNVVRQEKLVGLWKGITPSMARCVPGVGMYFATLHVLSSHLTNGVPNPLEAVLLGLAARSISGTALLPFTVVKTRFESGVYQYNGIYTALKKIYGTEGAKGLYCGLAATLLRDAPFSGLYLMFYTQTRKLCPNSLKEGQFSSLVFFSCGVVSGSMASLLTQPADVIKTQLQLFPERFGNTTEAIIHIYKTNGLNGYFRGLAPRLLRRTLMSAMSWTIYEHMMKRVGLL